MFTVDYQGFKYDVEFVKDVKKKRYTATVFEYLPLQDENKMGRMYVGHSKYYKNDTFEYNPAVGRRNALTHAVSQIEDRELRKLIWEEYFKRSPTNKLKLRKKSDRALQEISFQDWQL